MSAIQFEAVGKQYHKRGQVLFHTDLFWAIQDLSWALSEGETVGLIGSNGSGKTTLLKLIAGITAPTRGTIHVQGRVVPMISLSGCLAPFFDVAENVKFLLSVFEVPRPARRQIFQQIVAFSELGEFRQMPLKHCSSGMQARLAFAIAVHVPGDILLVDEALAVGDSYFRDKCLHKIEQIQSEGRTIVFCSHRLDAVKRLCRRIAWLEDGRLKMDGPSEKVVEAYRSCPN